MADTNKLTIEIPLVVDELLKLVETDNVDEEEVVGSLAFIAAVAAQDAGGRGAFLTSLALELAARSTSAADERAAAHETGGAPIMRTRLAAIAMCLTAVQRAKSVEF